MYRLTARLLGKEVVQRRSSETEHGKWCQLYGTRWRIANTSKVFFPRQFLLVREIGCLPATNVDGTTWSMRR